MSFKTWTFYFKCLLGLELVKFNIKANMILCLWKLQSFLMVYIVNMKWSGLMKLICMLSHQAKFIQVCKQPPWVNISKAALQLQVCERRQKHLNKKKQKTSDRRSHLLKPGIKFQTSCYSERKTWRHFLWKELSVMLKITMQQELGFIWAWSICLCSVCIVGAVNGHSHLFENHELIQEVNALAGEEFPDGLLSLSTLRITGHAHLLILEELGQTEVLHRRTKQPSRNPQRSCSFHPKFLHLWP